MSVAVKQYVAQFQKQNPGADVASTTSFVNAKLSEAGKAPVSAAVVSAELGAIAAEQAKKGKAGAGFLGSISSFFGFGSKSTAATAASLAGASAGATEAPAALKKSSTPKAESPATAQKAKDKSVSEVFLTPTSRTSTTLRFIMPDHSGKEIKPSERWLFEIPEDLRGAHIRTVIVAHRKDSKYGASVDANGHDSQGAYNLVTARVAGTDKWVTWSDQYGSKKFAEPRSSGDPENENLHDWLDSVGAQTIDIVAMTNVGKGELAVANVHFVEIEFFPAGKPTQKIEAIFSKGTRFADPDKDITMPSYGGGMGAHLSQAQMKEKGLYPDAVVLGWGSGTPETAKALMAEKGMRQEGSQLFVKLPAGKIFRGLEVAIGDTQFDKNKPIDEQRNKDGHVGSLGWAKLNASVVNKATGSSSRFMSNMNVPPSGVLSGGPVEQGYVAKEGDEICIQTSGSTAYVMGVRVLVE